MKFLAACLLAFVMGTTAARAELLYEVSEISSPAGKDSIGATLAKSPEGTVWLSWVESVAPETRIFQVSQFDETTKKWSAPQTVHRGSDLLATAMEFPALAVGPAGRATAIWSNDKGGAFFSQSRDRGKTWSTPRPLTTESDAVEKISSVALADGRVMAAWLDGRSAKSGGKTTQLYARFLGEAERDQLVDPSVCDCCPLALTRFPDGTVLLAYRGRTQDEIRDILVASYLDGRWDPRIANTHDRWKIAGCPMNGPRLASDGPRVSKAWFTAANESPRVLVATSPDAGGIYTRAVQADLGSPAGNVDTVLLRDGTQLVTWLENSIDPEGRPNGSLYLRRYGPGGNTSPPALLATLKDLRAAGFPRIALVKDFDATSAQLIVTFHRGGDTPGTATLLVTMPDEDLLADADRECACGHRPEELRGSAVRGQILLAAADGGSVRVRHGAIPGVLRAGEREFKISPEALRSLPAPAEILGRIEQRDGEWWLFDVRLLGQPQR